MATKTTRTDPRIIREALNHFEANGPYITGAKFGLFASTLYRWARYRAERGPEWPTDQDIAVWDAHATIRASNARRWRRTAQRQHFKTGPALIDGTGTRRRLQGLVAIGHSQAKIGAALDLTGSRISQLCVGRKCRLVFRETAAKIAALYDEWWDVIPVGRNAGITRAYAASQQWRTPLAWDDDSIDDPNAEPQHAPEPVPDGADYIDHAAVLARIEGNREIELTPAEQLELVHQMTADGWGQKRIEAQTGINAARILREERARQAAEQDQEAAA